MAIKHESSGNSSLDKHSADFGIFGASQTSSLVSAPKIPKNNESHTENLSVVLNAKNAESSKQNSEYAQETIAQNDAQPKLRPIIKGANGLSLGISIVVAILLGIGAGVLMQKIFGVFWVLFLGVAWGIAAAILNVYKVYKAELRDFEKIANDPKYKSA